MSLKLFKITLDIYKRGRGSSNQPAYSLLYNLHKQMHRVRKTFISLTEGYRKARECINASLQNSVHNIDGNFLLIDKLTLYQASPIKLASISFSP